MENSSNNIWKDFEVMRRLVIDETVIPDRSLPKSRFKAFIKQLKIKYYGE